MRTVMLRRTWQGEFRRSIRDEKGEVAKLLHFGKETPVEVTEDEFRSLLPDIGKALVEVVIDEKGKIRLVEQSPEPEPSPLETDKGEKKPKKKSGD